MGRTIHFDPATERITGDEEAGGMLTRARIRRRGLPKDLGPPAPHGCAHFPRPRPTAAAAEAMAFAGAAAGPGLRQPPPGDHRHRATQSEVGTDATATFTEVDGAVTVFAVLDHCTAHCVSLHAVKKATRFEALEQRLQERGFPERDQLPGHRTFPGFCAPLLEFRDRYNQHWILERPGYRTPLQARRDFQIALQVAA